MLHNPKAQQQGQEKSSVLKKKKLGILNIHQVPAHGKSAQSNLKIEVKNGHIDITVTRAAETCSYDYRI